MVPMSNVFCRRSVATGFPVQSPESRDGDGAQQRETGRHSLGHSALVLEERAMGL